MSDNDWLVERFEANRAQLRAVAYRMLGSAPEADDVVQEAWVRVSKSDHESVDNLGAWLTTVVGRLCLDVLRTRRARREEPIGHQFQEARLPDAPVAGSPGADPEHELLLADSLGPALLVVLDSLAPAERLALVLHDMFAVPFDEIGPMVGRSPVAARQLASRARRRVQGATAGSSAASATAGPATAGSSAATAGPAREREIVSAFLAASRGGDFEALVLLLDPDVVLRADRHSVEAAAANQARGAPALTSEVRGPREVAGVFSGRARPVQLALVDGGYGAAFAIGGKPWAVFGFSVIGDLIVEIEIMSDPSTVQDVEVTLLNT
jgi:RNA polymerase sigma factor (sigma-70 family)